MDDLRTAPTSATHQTMSSASATWADAHRRGSRTVRWLGSRHHACASGDTQGDVQDVAVASLTSSRTSWRRSPTPPSTSTPTRSVGWWTRLALLELEDRGADLDRLGLVTTLGTPHRGADLATAIVAANTGLLTNLTLDAATARWTSVSIPTPWSSASSPRAPTSCAAWGSRGCRPGSTSCRSQRGAIWWSRTSHSGGRGVTSPSARAGRSQCTLVGTDTAHGRDGPGAGRSASRGASRGPTSWPDVLSGQAISALEGHVADGASAPGVITCHRSSGFGHAMRPASPIARTRRSGYARPRQDNAFMHQIASAQPTVASGAGPTTPTDGKELTTWLSSP